MKVKWSWHLKLSAAFRHTLDNNVVKELVKNWDVKYFSRHSF